VDFEAIDTLRERHVAWRLLRAGNASLILSFLGDFFVEGNRGSCSASEVGAALDDHLYVLNSDAFPEPGVPGRAASAIRRFGMGIVQRVGPLKSQFMAEARGESGELPLLLRGLTI